MVRLTRCLCMIGAAAAAEYSVFTATLTELSGSGVTGDVMIFASSTGLLGVGTGAGLEASLNSMYGDGTDCNATNGCGVHVHAGDSCADNTSQGGHYFTGASDPWATVGYIVTGANGAAKFDFMTQDSATDIAGKPFIIHNDAGGRVACGLLSIVATGVTSASLAALNSSGVTGEVTVYTTSSHMFGAGMATGLETDLVKSQNCTAHGNACGAHVHSGTSCANSTTQGGHYYSGSSDPWTTVMYPSTNAAGVASFVFMVASSASEVAMKPFLVHDSMGSRVSCGILASETPGSSGSNSGSDSNDGDDGTNVTNGTNSSNGGLTSVVVNGAAGTSIAATSLLAAVAAAFA